MSFKKSFYFLIAQVDTKEQKEEKTPTLYEVISKDVGFKEFYEILKNTEYLEKFKENGAYTVFVPTNGALERLSPKMLKDLKKPENQKKLITILNSHILPGVINKKDMTKAIQDYRGSVKLKTIGGTRLIASIKQDKIYLIDYSGNAGRLMINDIETSNGIIHTIESVMMTK